MTIRLVLAAMMVLVRGDVSKDAELLVLRHENAVLRLWGAETGLAWLS
jgi:hypothetical protein